MRIDLPQCGFKSCKFQADGNCLYQKEYQRCEYIKATQALKFIIGSQKLCALCQNNGCKDSLRQNTDCTPIWTGLLDEQESEASV